MKAKKILSLLLCMAVLTSNLVGCVDSNGDANDLESNIPSTEITSQMFSDRDMESGYDENNATIITLVDDSTKSDSKSVSVSENTVTISDEGVYIFKGSLSEGQIIIDGDKTDKIQIVLDNVDISNSSSAPIYVKLADKVFITLANGSQNRISVKGEFISIDDNNIDAAIFSKDDLTINGSGKITVVNEYGNGITSKDDLIVTNGIYDITVSGHGLEGKDRISIANGEFNITSGKDGIHSENSDDSTLGSVYILDGNFKISSVDDGIHADSNVTIEDGTIDIIKSYEGIEGQCIEMNGGIISLVSSDDGINATAFSVDGELGQGDVSDVYIKIAGGIININSDSDGIDANGNLYVIGGETYVAGPQNDGNGALDYDGVANISGGIVVAVGSSGMAQNFGDTSTQGSILVTSQTMQEGDVSLKDSNGKELISYTPTKQYNSVVISTPDIKDGETYTITMGSEIQNIEMTSLIYGNGKGPGAMGGRRPKFGGEMKGERPERPEGTEIPK